MRGVNGKAILKSPYIKCDGSGKIKGNCNISPPPRMFSAFLTVARDQKAGAVIAKLLRDFPDSQDYLNMRTTRRPHRGGRLCFHQCSAGTQLGCGRLSSDVYMS
jgi:hypothetical protein